LAAAVAGVIAVSLGHKWLDIRDKVIKGIGTAMPAILILFLIGSLAGTWMISGVVQCSSITGSRNFIRRYSSLPVFSSVPSSQSRQEVRGLR
ncbi:MAG: hypothetical protein MUC30_05235, partial [Bacteroidales bacterium]|nr:hypothetical protein [Bacteroidales bacterium]